MIGRKGLFLLVLLAGLIAVAGCAQKPAALADEGKKLFTSKGCSGCHGANGEGVPGVGPALKGLAGSQVELTDGTKVTADDAFILESVQKPDAKVVKGFSAIEMPDLGISDAEAKALLAYIKSL